MKYHYTYRITNILINKHYYGTRTSKNKLPKEDIGIYYFSSSRDKDFMQDQKDNPQNYKYKVIRISNTRKEAMLLEIYFHSKFNVAINGNFYNKTKATSTGFDITGTNVTKGICVKSKNGRALKINIYDQFDKLRFPCHGDFLEVCSNNKLPERTLRKSYKEKGKPIYSTNNAKAQANKAGNFTLIGWYALIQNS